MLTDPKQVYTARQVLLAARRAYTINWDNRKIVNEHAQGFTSHALQLDGIDPEKSTPKTPVTVQSIVDAAWDMMGAECTDRLMDALEDQHA